ncbi:Arylsulfatase precursor [Thalassoglobus neptunius]|uniref:Arylsulfatase n=1 Tax=Thalassoglobus neptunius TaxID=1938619 RepID=A0A5C5X5D2_9PLAN|nr:arylsulfatase [Thalassoglobus neptunius]TWT57829.1 Arylsulfatase precursor [Thalassoglobus neptunius]
MRGHGLCCLLIVLANCSAQSVVAEGQPNVVLVITDDQGYGDLSCHGNPVLKTPAIDALFEESVRLTDYHVSPTCSPTRAALVTGHWTNRTGVWHTIMGRSMLRENEVTMGQIFKDNGYATGMFGKWHLGDNAPYRPEDRGYTEVLRHGGGGVGQTPDYWDNAYFDGSYWHNGEVEPAEGFCTDVFFEAAMDFIDEESSAGRPFLAYIATNAPHGPMHSPEEFSAPYAGLNNFGLENFFGMIANIDYNVERLRSFLDEKNLTENTIFIFTTDNGSSSGWKLHNSGMRAGKGSPYDGGHRVPFFIYWPEGDLTGGRDVTPITAHVDVIPTLLELCGLTPPKSVKFDGQSIVSLLKGEDSDWPDRILVTDSQRVNDPIKWRQSSVMTSQWRLINGKELYDIQQDPGQESDIASGHPEVVERLRDFYEEWWADLLPSFKQNAAIHLGDARDNPARLTSHDWITTGSTPWNQGHIRSALNGDANTGFWNVNVLEDGLYRIRLRRWPEETQAALNAELPPGDPVPGTKAFRTTPGKPINPVRATLKIGDLVEEKSVDPDAEEVVFEVQIPAGPTQMSALLEAPDGTVYGAYYAYVEKLNQRASLD